MQRKKGYFFRRAILNAFFFSLMLSSVHAAKPLWTFVPQTPTNITVAQGSNAQIIYTVFNQSSRTKTLVMKSIKGIHQPTPCHLPAKGMCTLTLNIKGSALQGDVSGGPILCQQGNQLQCYQPSLAHSLRIHRTEQPIQQFTITPLADMNGSIFPAAAQVVTAGSSIMFTATPNAGFGVGQWLLDGAIVQNGGGQYQLSNIQANHTVEVSFAQATLSPLTQNLTLSINNPAADPALTGNPRIIQIENTGSIAATGLQVTTSGFPTDTSITSNTCMGILNAGDACSITITPGGNASLDGGNNACIITPGTQPIPTTVTVAADNASSTTVNVLILGYGCIHQGGFLFSVDDTTPNTQSIGGKVAALTNEPGMQWAIQYDDTAADSTTDGLSNTNALAAPAGRYPAAQTCLNKSDGGFSNWYLPAICELGRFTGLGLDAGCGTTNPNLYSTLHANNLGGFDAEVYWSSTEFNDISPNFAWFQNFGTGAQDDTNKFSNNRASASSTFNFGVN